MRNFVFKFVKKDKKKLLKSTKLEMKFVNRRGLSDTISDVLTSKQHKRRESIF